MLIENGLVNDEMKTSRARLPAIGVRAGLVVIGLLGALTGLELAVRLIRPEPQELFEPHPVLGVFHVPNTEAIWNKEGRAMVRINQLGVRDRELPLEKAPGVYRIIVLGDSFVEALQVPLEQTFVKVTETLLNRWARAETQFEVINAGVSGYGTAQEYLWFRHYGVQLRPDLIVLAFFVGNDVRNNSVHLEPYAPTPFFVLDGAGLSLSGRAFYFENPLKAWLRSRSHLYLALIRAKARLNMGAQAARLVNIDLGVFVRKESAEWSEAWEITRRLLHRINRLARDGKANFILLALPDPYQVSPHLPSAASSEALDLGRPQRRLAKFARVEGIQFVDVLPCLRQSYRQDDRIFFRDRGHFTSRGHRLVGEVLFRRLAGVEGVAARLTGAAAPQGCPKV